MKILSIDPGAIAGFAYRDTDHPTNLLHGRLNMEKVTPSVFLFSSPEITPDLLVCEDQFVGVNPKSAIKIVERRRDWQNALAHCDQVLVKPRSWQSKMLGRMKTTEELKEASRYRVAMIYPYLIPEITLRSGKIDDNVTDAICLLDYIQGIIAQGGLKALELYGLKIIKGVKL
jgi:hypothetical protein